MKLFEIKKTPGGRTKGYLCGIKIFSYRCKEQLNLNDLNLQVGRDQMAAYRAIFNDDWHPEMKPGMIGAVFVLTSRYICLLEAAFERQDIYFHVLELPYEYMSIPVVKDLLMKNRNRIGHIFDNDPRSYEAFFETNASDYDLKFEQIREYSCAHQKVQRMLMRHVFDMNEVDYRFIHSLRFWLGVFERNDIKFVFSDRAEHGDCGDALLYEVADKHNVPIYLLAVETASFEALLLSLKRWHKFRYDAISIKNVLGEDSGIDISQYVHNRDSANVRAFRHHVYDERSLIKTGKSLSVRANEMIRCRCKCTDLELFYADTRYFSSWGTRNPVQVYHEWLYVSQLLHAYNQITIRPNLRDKYVFYGLHMEPEATINNRGLMSSQLFAIKALSQSLPDGWKLYIKEHPHQFSVCDESVPGSFHMSNNIGYFRSKQFYAEILRNPNTYLVSLDEPSESLIENAQAVATICGTIALEAIIGKKPLLVFSDETCVISKTRGVFCVHSLGECSEALSKVSTGYIPAYDDWNEIVNSYLLEISDYMSLNSNTQCCNKLARVIDWMTAQVGLTGGNQ